MHQVSCDWDDPLSCGALSTEGLDDHPSRRSELNLCGGIVHWYELTIHSFYIIIDDFPLLEGFENSTCAIGIVGLRVWIRYLPSRG